MFPSTRRETMFILTAHEKHGDRRFAANDKDGLGRIALKILRERQADGYWYPSREELEKEHETDLKSAARMAKAESWLQLTEEEVAALPAAIKTEAIEALEKYRVRVARLERDHTNEVAFVDSLEEILGSENPDLKKAYALLSQRNIYEYEDFTVDEVDVY